MTQEALRKLFGQKLKTAREESDIKQNELAEMLDTYSEKISQMERGLRLPYKSEFDTICNLLNKEANYFFPDEVPILSEDTRKPNNRTKNRYGGHGFDRKFENTNKIKDDKTGLILNTNKKIEEVPIQEEIISEEEVVENVIHNATEVLTNNNTKRKISIQVPTGNGTSIMITIEEENVK